MLDQLPVELVAQIASHIHPYQIPLLRMLSKSAQSRFDFIDTISFALVNVQLALCRPKRRSFYASPASASTATNGGVFQADAAAAAVGSEWSLLSSSPGVEAGLASSPSVPPSSAAPFTTLTNAEIFSIKWYRLGINYWAVLFLLRGLTERTFKTLTPHHFISFSLTSPTTFPSLPYDLDPVTVAYCMAKHFAVKTNRNISDDNMAMSSRCFVGDFASSPVLDVTLDRYFPLIHAGMTGNLEACNGMLETLARDGRRPLLGLKSNRAVLERVVLVAVRYGSTEIVKRFLDTFSGLECGEFLVSAATVGHEELFQCLLDKIGLVRLHTHPIPEPTPLAAGLDEEESEEDDDDEDGFGWDDDEADDGFEDDEIADFEEQISMLPSPPLSSSPTRRRGSGHPTSYGTLALCFASTSGHLSIVRRLLSLNCDPNLVQQNKAVVGAAKNGHLTILKLLIENGCDPARPGNEPLVRAAENGNAEVVSYLLGFPGVDPGARGNKALKSAAFLGHEDVVRVLMKTGKVDVKAENSFAVRMATEHGYVRIVKLLAQDR
ncbi:hypothetical protein HDU97_005730 [Phlyctochytrium planicorne]|nr:hypothetical protein HDU97_005730 [Phlyctochytrium planicorne]